MVWQVYYDHDYAKSIMIMIMPGTGLHNVDIFFKVHFCHVGQNIFRN